MTKISSLYVLIKQEYTKKGRGLKIICDWDEVLCGNKSRCFWILARRKGSDLSYADWIKEYWEKSIQTYKSYGMNVITHLDILENYRQNDKEAFEAEFKAIKADPNFYLENPFFSIAEQLKYCLEENLISELIIVSSYREEAYEIEGEPKKKIFEKTFAKFPQCKLDLCGVKRDVKQKELTMGQFPGKRITARWKVLKEKYPDFDIFIDDNPNIMKEVKEAFVDQQEKIYVFPDYKCNSHIVGNNVYRVENPVSDVCFNDFTYQKLENSLSPKKTNYTPWIIVGISSLAVLLMSVIFVYFWKRKKSKK